jgi:hypothetical protein
MLSRHQFHLLRQDIRFAELLRDLGEIRDAILLIRKQTTGWKNTVFETAHMALLQRELTEKMDEIDAYFENFLASLQ